MALLLSGKCFICMEKAEQKCSVCQQEVCIYHCNIKEHMFVKTFTCNACVASSCNIDKDFLEANYVKDQQRLRVFEEQRVVLEAENEELQSLMDLDTKRLEESMKKHNQNVEEIKNRILLEEQSNNNAKSAAKKIYSSIETKKEQILGLEGQLEELVAENETLDMIIQHKNIENIEIQKRIHKMTRQSFAQIDVSAIERILCKKCKMNVLANKLNPSVLTWSNKKNPKACASCIIN